MMDIHAQVETLASGWLVVHHSLKVMSFSLFITTFRRGHFGSIWFDSKLQMFGNGEVASVENDFTKLFTSRPSPNNRQAIVSFLHIQVYTVTIYYSAIKYYP